MTDQDDPRTIVRAIVGSNLYMVLGTADESGTPWVSPVWYAHDGTSTFYWVSSPEATHSRNIAACADVSIVIFDSGARIYAGQALYVSATAHLLTDGEDEAAIEVISRRSKLHGADTWTVDDVRPPARLRLYRAVASARWILEPGAPTDRRIEVPLDEGQR